MIRSDSRAIKNAGIAGAATGLLLATAYLLPASIGMRFLVVSIFASAALAYVEANRLSFWNYHIPFPKQSDLAAVFVGAMWIVGFPLFIYSWLCIRDGTARPVD